jgi:uncharacterized membrane protein (DUF4010 family)
VSYSAISKQQKGFGWEATVVILVASAVVYGRVLFELSLVAPALLPHATAPMALYAAVLLVLSASISRRAGKHTVRLPEQKNPAQFGLALSVAVVYVVIVFAVALTKDLVGGRAIYALATISGLTDVDALTLSVAQHFSEGDLSPDRSWRAIFLATLSNLVFKTGVAAVLGSPALRRVMLAAGSGAVVSGLLILLLWP